MNDFVLNIDGYEGPIELLLDLAKKQKVDLKHISILELADQYSNYVKNKIKTTNLTLVADYLCSTLKGFVKNPRILTLALLGAI